MGDTNELMEFLSASLGATLDEIYQRLIDCDFTREDPRLRMFVVALLNALGREGRGNRPTEVVLMLAFGDSGTAERGRNRLMRWRRGEMSGHDLAREPGLGEQRDHRLGEMPLPVQPAQPLIGAKRQRDGPGPSHSVDSPTAAPPPKRVRVSEIEILTSETIETLEKKERDQSELCAKLQEYRAIARERDEWKKKYEDLQVAYKEDEIKHMKELYMAKVSQVSQEVLATMKSSEGSSDTSPRTRVQELCASRGPEAPQQTQQSASSQRNTIPDPSDTYLAPQFQESFNQVARATMVIALPPVASQIPGKNLCFLVVKATDRQHVDPKSLVLALTRLRDFLVERGVTSLSLPVYDPNRGKLHPRELYALVHVIFSETDIEKLTKYYLSIC